MKNKGKRFKGMSAEEISELGSIRDEVFKILSDNEVSFRKVRIITEDINTKYKEIADNAVVRNANIILEKPEIETITVYRDRFPWWAWVPQILIVIILASAVILK